jgi:hypothetical protein
MNMNDGAVAKQATSVQDNALATTQEFSNELAPTAAAEAAKQEIQAAVILAKRFPRNEDEAYQQIIKACKRPRFAEDVSYSFPRGGKAVTGPSVYLAREFARVWGNIRHGCDIVTDTDAERTIRAWAWDIQTNTKVSSDVTFKKLIQRKQKDGSTKWIVPDERDLRELTNKQAAIAKRNCLLELLPSDMVDDCEEMARKTAKNRAAEDPDTLRKNLVSAFADLSVSVAELEKYLEHPLSQCSPTELVGLRAVYKSIKDGNSTWAEYINGNGDGESADLKKKAEEAAAKLKDKLKKDDAEPDFKDAEIVGETKMESGTLPDESKKGKKAEPSLAQRCAEAAHQIEKKGICKPGELGDQFLNENEQKFSELSEERAADVLPSLQEILNR